MKLTNVSIRNYKGLQYTETPLSNFVCAIGENNSGKSSLLQSLLLFINGARLSKEEYYDPNDDILITVSLEGVTVEELSKLTEEHRKKIKQYVKNEKIVLMHR